MILAYQMKTEYYLVQDFFCINIVWYICITFLKISNNKVIGIYQKMSKESKAPFIHFVNASVSAGVAILIFHQHLYKWSNLWVLVNVFCFLLFYLFGQVYGHFSLLSYMAKYIETIFISFLIRCIAFFFF